MEIKDGAMTTTLPDTTPVMSYPEWLAEGEKRFGKDFDKWSFICPICGNVAAVGDYRPYKAQGASPDSAAQECIGRYSGSGSKAFGSEKERGKPCDYAIYGLFRIPGIVIQMDDGQRRMSFAFAEPGCSEMG